MATGAYPEPGQTVNYNNPAYYTDTGTQFAGGVQDLLGQNGYINDVANNWYSDSPTQGALGQYAQYNPGTMNNFMNPYTQNVVNEQARLSNQNLNEQILPGVNSTFAGAGQFGSTRNADFINRAIRDQQQNLMGQQGQTLFNAQNQANTNYKDWTQMGLGAGQQDFTNWQAQANYPLSALTQVGQMYGNLRPAQPSSINTSSVDTGGNLQKLGSVLSILNTGLNDSTIQSLLAWAGLQGAVPTGG